ncbi:C5a anaphylatoxin chemotactic receptor 1 [Hemicordylus capensis]|uniref:C5a anaphylatoxin chemotactic receptor 1 n=1 Tax=Hemicordylus capensis TaxID=884348 RepID=UPI0023034A28|nr:C5a anaphylatoxin chemotactic receptor 1 [Hemicordylus capensis]
MDFQYDYTAEDLGADANFTAPDFEEMHQLSLVIWVAMVIYSLVFLVGVLGNGAVIWVMSFKMRHTVNAVWFLNLSVADLLCCLALPILVAQLASDHHWHLGDFGCKLFPSLITLNMFASVLLLTAISMDRCALVIRPVWCQNHRSAPLAWLLCCVAWASALVLTLPSFLTRTAELDVSSQKTTCNVKYSVWGGDSEAAEVAVAVVRFLCGFLIPLGVISACYGLLIWRVSGRRSMRSKKTLKVVLVVVVGFFLCWAPYHVAGLILSGNRESALYEPTRKADPLFVALAYINSCINPIIYVIVGRDFKAKMRQSLKAVLQNLLSEEARLASSMAEGHVQTTYTTTEDRSTSMNV